MSPDAIEAHIRQAIADSPDNGASVDVATAEIDHLPDGAVQALRDAQVAKLSLSQGQLKALPLSFATLSRLRYLNLRNNAFRDFPPVLCDMPRLEVLDISRNKIRALPANFGNLINLRVLSIMKNRIDRLPAYIGDMHELKLLKLEGNPISWPPSDVWESNTNDQTTWLASLQRFLRETDQLSSASANLAENVPATIKALPAQYRAEFENMRKSLESIPFAETAAATAVAAAAAATTPGTTSSSSSSASRHAAASRSDNSYPHAPAPPAKDTQSAAKSVTRRERERSNSDLHVSEARVSSRLRRLASSSFHSPHAQHQRGLSHDSQLGVSAMAAAAATSKQTRQEPSSKGNDENAQAATRAASGGLRSGLRRHAGSDSSGSQGNDFESGSYFRRLSNLPEARRNILGSVQVLEAARGVLFALSQVQTAIKQYVIFCGDSAAMNMITRMLYNANTHLGALVATLEVHEHETQLVHAESVVDACIACTAAFRQVVVQMRKRMYSFTAKADVRYTRTLLLLLFHATRELHNSWDIILPVVKEGRDASNTGVATPVSTVSTPIPPSRLQQRLQRNLAGSSQFSLGNLPNAGLSKPIQDVFSIPSTPQVVQSMGIAHQSQRDTDEKLFEKISQATSIGLQTFAMLSDTCAKTLLKSSTSGPTSPGHESNASNGNSKPGAANTTKPSVLARMREMSAASLSAGDLTRGIRLKLVAIRDTKEDRGEQQQRRLYEDVQAFIRSVIGIANLSKAVTVEVALPKQIMQGLSTLTRSTKELTILLSASSFGQPSEGASAANQTPSSGSSMLAPPLTSQLPGLSPPPISTPLSAALGTTVVQSVLSSPHPAGPDMNQFDMAMGIALHASPAENE